MPKIGAEYKKGLHVLFVGSRPISLHQVLNPGPRSCRGPHVTTPLLPMFFCQNLEASIPFYFQNLNTPKTRGRPQKDCKSMKCSARVRRIKDGHVKMTLSLSKLTVVDECDLFLFVNACMCIKEHVIVMAMCKVSMACSE